MSVNNMTFEQAASLLNSIQEQVTGETALTPTTTSDFISCAQKTIAAGYDPVLNAITQTVGRTIFSIRPYNRQFRNLMMSEQKWGAITRKLSIADKDWDDNDEFKLVDGQSIDMFTVSKPNVLQMNFYGAMVYQRHYTIFKNQLDNAFKGPEEFAEFMTMVTQNCLDIIEQSHESIARLAIGNFIAGKIDNNGSDVIHLLTEYNADTGSSLTNVTVFAPANFPNFVKWLYSRIDDLTKMMTQRTQLYQINVQGQEINRHSPLTKQKVYLYSKFLAEINARVKADTYHDNYLELSDVESVPYWQSATQSERMSIDITPVVLDPATGSLVTGSQIQQDFIIGVIFDEEAIGQTLFNTWTATTPLNAAGGYWNIYYHYTERYFNDFTEKGVVLVLD